MAIAFLDAPGPLAFAHRGGAAHAPENSWRAFEHAVGLGYRYLETDLHATADGVLVAFHDKTLTRVCGQDGRVSRLSYAELSAARINGTEQIPVLEDLLTAWPDIRFNLDVKDVPAIAPLPDVLRRTNAWDRVCLVSFSASRLRATRRALGHPVCMAASPLGTAVVRFGGPRGRHDKRGPGRGQGPVTKERGLEPSGGSRGVAPPGQQGTGTALALLPRFPRLVVTRTMSKAFALAGARVGYLAAEQGVVDALLLVRLPYHLSAQTQAVARAALAHADGLLATVADLRAERDALVDWLRGRGLTAADSDANFVLFGRFGDSHAVWQGMLDRGVLVREVGPPGWLRVSIGTPAEMAAFR